MQIRPDPENRSIYQQEFKESVEIFNKSFHGEVESDFNPQKEQYTKAMHAALTAMGDAANGLASEELKKMKEQLSADTKEYLAHPSTNKQRLVEKDIENLKRATD